MSGLLESSSVWILAGSLIFGVCLFVGRCIATGKEPQQMGDEVK